MKFKLGKIKCEISFLFTALLSVMILFDQTGVVDIFFLAAFIHEGAHLAVMCAVRSVPSEIRLVPGGIFIVNKSVNTPLEDILILIAGPLSNLICFLLSRGDFSLLNLLLFLYNILPVRGIDGGSLIWIILSRFFSARIAELTLNILTAASGLFFAVAFFLLFREGTKNYSLLIFSLYIISCLFLKKGVERKE